MHERAEHRRRRIAWFGGTIVCVFAGLLARGIPLSEIFGAGGSTDGGGDGGGDAGC
jgi:hypothetical protein